MEGFLGGGGGGCKWMSLVLLALPSLKIELSAAFVSLGRWSIIGTHPGWVVQGLLFLSPWTVWPAGLIPPPLSWCSGSRCPGQPKVLQSLSLKLPSQHDLISSSDYLSPSPSEGTWNIYCSSNFPLILMLERSCFTLSCQSLHMSLLSVWIFIGDF